MLDFTRASRMIGTVAIAIGLLELTVAVAVLIYLWSWHSGAMTATGTVVAHETTTHASSRRGSSSATYAEIVRFTDASGAQHEFRSRISSSDPFAVGTAVPVRYSAAGPSDATIDSWFRLWGFPLIFVGAGLLFTAVGFAFRGLGDRFGRLGA